MSDDEATLHLDQVGHGDITDMHLDRLILLKELGLVEFGRHDVFVPKKKSTRNPICFPLKNKKPQGFPLEAWMVKTEDLLHQPPLQAAKRASVQGHERPGSPASVPWSPCLLSRSLQ